MTNGKTILIADDDKDLAHVLATRCQKLGLHVVLAHDCLSALNFAACLAPDLVCLDINMPAGNGLSVCEMLAANVELPSIPIIILTGRTDEETIRRCHGLCAYYVLKCDDTWGRLEPLIHELLAANPVTTASSEKVARIGAHG